MQLNVLKYSVTQNFDLITTSLAWSALPVDAPGVKSDMRSDACHTPASVMPPTASAMMVAFGLETGTIHANRNMDTLPRINEQK